jgi:hypothetical protein
MSEVVVTDAAHSNEYFLQRFVEFVRPSFVWATPKLQSIIGLRMA